MAPASVEAEFLSKCPECFRPIIPSQRIIPSTGYAGWAHEQCPTDALPAGPVCTDCFMLKPCPCDDGQ